MAARLKLARERKGYKTATDAAKALGLSSTYLGHENASRGFLKSARRYARFFGVRLQWLIANEGDMTGKNTLDSRFAGLDPAKQQELLNFWDFLDSRGHR